MFTHSRRLTFIILLFILLSTATITAEHVTVQLHFAITEAMEAAPPEVIDDHLVLTYKGRRHYRFVGAAFKHEDFKIIHPFYVNTNGVYILTYPLEEGMSNLEYRLVVDGLWMTDPNNSMRTVDSSGITLSSFMIPEKEGPPESPKQENQAVTFRYLGARGQRVYIYGDFNNWDPYMYRMMEDPGTGSYSCSLRLRSGTYRYKFIVDGTSMPDPLNDEKTLDSFGETASVFTVPSRY
ncbi:MAG: hypothetical protein PQJ61_06270 [Spirochaetales bacterium]|uniref:AMP-activated protein kinase glycogen-binding domain-containing protein n=1 Tax=Candidatus Thalassospirochaeta sargassi TaxID=3119039 RepID=A0AAJ1IFC6_9SPIO|nr:hypothetical protein [Spirochaetales bacterium]